MTNDAQRAAIKEMIKQHTKTITASPEAARAFLIQEGFLSANGELAPAYGGPEQKAVNNR